MNAAGVGGHHPAEGRRVAGRYVDTELGVHLASGHLGRRQGRAGFRLDDGLLRVAADDAVEPTEAQHGLTLPRHRASHKACIAALGNHADVETVARREYLGDLSSAAWPYHHEGRAPEPPRPVELVGSLEIGVAQAVRSSDGLGHGGKEAWRGLAGVSHEWIFSPRRRAR